MNLYAIGIIILNLGFQLGMLISLAIDIYFSSHSIGKDYERY